ncbi:MAG: GTPase [Planctomycetaceae bacterium]
MWSASELIVAPATVPGPGARAIVRLAGERLDDLLRRMFAVRDAAWPAGGEAPRVVHAAFAATGLRDAWGELGVEILCWPGPGGPVGGPLAEVQLPASAPLVDAVVAEACRLGARLARGGEFTLRAFLAGRLDLVQAEAVLGVVDARSPAELAAALDRLAGGAGAALDRARGELLDLLADIEAAIDFADEAIPDAVPAAPDWRSLAARLAGCRHTVETVAATLAGRDASAAGLPRVVLAGPPNIGKSSLFNAVVGRDAALVADEVGTTRDSVDARVVAGRGRPWVLVDVAGVGEAPAPRAAPAAAAREQAQAEIARADVVLACRDGAAAAAEPVAGGTVRIPVITRCDRGRPTAVQPEAIATSAATGKGVAELVAAIDSAVARLPPPASATLRMRAAAEAAARALGEAQRSVAAASAGLPIDEAMVAASLRTGVESLADATGAAIGGDLLDRIFSRHCIGK